MVINCILCTMHNNIIISYINNSYCMLLDTIIALANKSDSVAFTGHGPFSHMFEYGIFTHLKLQYQVCTCIGGSYIHH